MMTAGTSQRRRGRPFGTGSRMLVPEETEKQRQLDRMRRIATGLLGFAAIVFVVARLLEEHYPWVGFVRATAEAAMVGAIADWFAVTALFRYPLGIKIPHTVCSRRRPALSRPLLIAFVTPMASVFSR